MIDWGHVQLSVFSFYLAGAGAGAWLAYHMAAEFHEHGVLINYVSAVVCLALFSFCFGLIGTRPNDTLMITVFLTLLVPVVAGVKKGMDGSARVQAAYEAARRPKTRPPDDPENNT
jgi:ABC-type proline/glycine betaine transport system permease subunit